MSATRNDRTTRAERLLASCGQWLKLRDHDGRKLAYGIESERRPGVYHLANTRQCTCEDWVRGFTCKHVMAVRKLVTRVAAQRESAKIIPFPTPGSTAQPVIAATAP
jgi:SWIM zinc finger